MAGNINVFGISATDNTKQAFDSVNRNMDRTSKNAQKMNGQLRLMRGGLGQVGHQIQDVAVQLQMGQNPLMVLTQQGSQVASLFGPTGAVVGAIGAVAGALAAAFLPKLMDSADRTKELHDTVADLSSLMKEEASTGLTVYAGKLEEISGLSEAAADHLRLMAVIQAEDRFRELNEEMGDTAEKFDRIRLNASRGMAQATTAANNLGLSEVQFKKLTKELETFDATSNQSRESLAQLLLQFLAMQSATGPVNDRFKELVTEFMGGHVEMSRLNNQLEKFSTISAPSAGEEVEDVTSKFDNFIDSLTKSVRKAEGFTPAQLLALQLQGMEGLDQAERDLAADLIRRLRRQELAAERSKDQADADRDAAQATRELQKAQKAFADADAALFKDNFGDAVGASGRQKKDRTVEAFERLSATYDTRMETIMTREQAELDILNEYAKLGAEQHERAEALKAEITERYANERMIQEMNVAEQQRQVMGMQVQALQGFTQFMSQNLQEGSSIQKAFYAATQAAQAAMTIINAHSAGFAATRNMLAMGADPATALATGKFITGVGYAQAAMIVAQTMASFEGGGFTGRGSRSGGLDGKGGFMAMLHPNETVLDHTKGQGSGITIVNNVDARGAGPEVDQKIQQAMQATSQQTIATVQDLMRRRRM